MVIMAKINFKTQHLNLLNEGFSYKSNKLKFSLQKFPFWKVGSVVIMTLYH